MRTPPSKRILENRRKWREYEEAREIYDQLISGSLDRVIGQLDAYSGEGLKRRILGIVEDYKGRVSQAKGLDELDALSFEIGYIEVALLNPQIIAAFYNADELRLEGEIPDYRGTEKEAGGKLVPNVYNVDGRKVLSLRLKKTVDGTETSMQILDAIVDGEIGKWHSHPSDIPIPSVGDLLSSMDIGLFPHVIATVQESRLYINRFLRGLVSDTLRAQLMSFSHEDRRNELVGLGYSQEDYELKYNFSKRVPLFYIPLQKSA